MRDLDTEFEFKVLSASYYHTCGILEGDNPIPLEPVPPSGVVFSPDENRTPSEIFSDYGDGDVLEQLSDGQVLCWGNKQNNQTIPPSHTFSSVSAGMYHTCGLLDGQNSQTAGRAVCWGAEDLPDENSNPRSSTFLGDPTANWGQAAVPPDLQNVTFTSISAGTYHTCAVREDTMRLACWGLEAVATVPENLKELTFNTVGSSMLMNCGLTTDNLLKCWGTDLKHWPSRNIQISNYNLNQFPAAAAIGDLEFDTVSAAHRHVCASQSNGKVLCWGADADPSTPEIDIYVGSTIINIRQAWVPRSFRAVPRSSGPPDIEEEEILPKPTTDIRILRIEPSIRGGVLRLGEPVRLTVEVYGRQDIRDDSLGNRPDVTFDWTIEDASSQQAVGEFQEAVGSRDDREANGEPDDRRVLHIASSEPGRYIVKSILEPGVECLGRRDGESDADAIERCTAEFELVVIRRSPVSPTPIPPRDPPGSIPEIIVDDAGTNYEVFTPEGGGSFETEKCSFRAPEGSVNNDEVIGVSIVELESPEQQIKVLDSRFMTDGLQCLIDAVSADGDPLVDYRLLK